MDIFEELESQVVTEASAASQVIAIVDDDELRLTDVQLGSDFLSGTIADCWALIKLNAISRISGSLPLSHEVSFEEAVTHLNWPRRVRFKVVGDREIALGAGAGFLKLHSRSGSFVRPLTAISMLLVEPVDNSKPGI